MSKKRRKVYTREFKVEAVKLVSQGGLSLAEVGRDLGIGPTLLGRWKKELETEAAQAFPGKGKVRPEDQELDRLRRENKRLQQERDFLRKTAAYFAKESE